MRQELDDRGKEIRNGVDVTAVDFDGERLDRLLDALAHYEMPEVVPALVVFIETRGRVQNALADFLKEAGFSLG